MLRKILLGIFALASTSWGGALPLTAKDLSLMLRAGYSSSTLAAELGQRRFADKLDADKEELLAKAGAAPELIADLKSGAYSLAPNQAAQAQAQLAIQADVWLMPPMSWSVRPSAFRSLARTSSTKK